MGLIKTIFAIIIISVIALLVCHSLRIQPYCNLTDNIAAFIGTFDTSSIIPSGPLELGTVASISSVAVAGVGFAKKKASELSLFKKQATEQISQISGTAKELEGSLFEKESLLEEKAKTIETQATEVSQALDAKKVAEDALAQKDKQIENLRTQLDALNNISAKAQALGENVDKLKVIKQVL